jgi:hypothetical protein
VPLSATQLFTAANFSGTITWTISPATNGSINSSTGLYSAPATFPTPNSVVITATSGAQTAAATATIVFPNDNQNPQSIPIKLGTSGGNATDTTATACCFGTLGSLWTRADLAQPVILSNNHVLDKSSFGANGNPIVQPGPAACFGSAVTKTVATLTQAAALAPAGTAAGREGASPSNTDSAIATIAAGTVDPTGSILDLGVVGASSIAAAAPSSQLATATLGMPVAKSGRTSGLTCSTVQSVGGSVSISYETACGTNVTAFTADYTGQVVVNGGTFSAAGDSGSLIVTQANARPVALLYGGSTANTVANPIQDVVAALSNGAANPLTIVGGADHTVGCSPEATASSAKISALSAQLSTTERQRVTAVQQQNSRDLMRNSAISSLQVGGSADSPGEGALVIHLSQFSSTPIPAVIDGVRTRVIYDNVQPSVGQAQIDHAIAVKEAHVAEYFRTPGIQGVAVSLSEDDPAQTAVSFYVIQGVSHMTIPPVIDGVRTKIFEGPQFKAF